MSLCSFVWTFFDAKVVSGVLGVGSIIALITAVAKIPPAKRQGSAMELATPTIRFNRRRRWTMRLTVASILLGVTCFGTYFWVSVVADQYRQTLVDKAKIAAAQIAPGAPSPPVPPADVYPCEDRPWPLRTLLSLTFIYIVVGAIAMFKVTRIEKG